MPVLIQLCKQSGTHGYNLFTYWDRVTDWLINERTGMQGADQTGMYSLSVLVV